MITVLMKKPIEDTEFSPQWMGACVCVVGGVRVREVRGRTVDIIAISGTRQTITSHSTLGVARRCSRMKESPTPTGADTWLMVKMRKENNHLLHCGSCDKTSLHTCCLQQLKHRCNMKERDVIKTSTKQHKLLTHSLQQQVRQDHKV